MGDTTPEVRVGDSERRAVDDRLMAAVGDGVLTLAEYDERAGVLWQARTRSELAALTADLPVAAPAPVPPAARPSGEVRRVVAVMSEDRFSGALAPGQAVAGWAVMGKAVVDLRRTDLPDGVHVRVRAVMGEVEVQVPPGSQVHLSGMALMGERKVRVAPGSGPVVHVDAYALMGAVNVTAGDGSVATADPPAAVRPAHSPLHERRAGLAHRVRGRLGGLLVPLAVLGGVLVAGPDSAAVFGSRTATLGTTQDSLQVSVLFGSVQVVVPDDVHVRTPGLVAFGSVDCEAACRAQGRDVEVRAIGGFGSVQVLTQTEYDAEQRDDESD